MTFWNFACFRSRWLILPFGKAVFLYFSGRAMPVIRRRAPGDSQGLLFAQAHRARHG